MGVLLQKLSKFSLNVLFPKECVGCGREGEWLCDVCASTIYINERFSCPICGKPTIFGNTCKKCRDDGFELNSLISATTYKDERVRKLLHTFKYKNCHEASEDLLKIMRKFFIKYIKNLPKIDLIIPVPLHKKRLEERGFNQSELLAKKVSEILSIETNNGLLIRVKNSVPQAELIHDERALNIENSFKIFDAFSLQTPSILLIDDVYTTGSTMQECARVLKQAGAREVHGFVIARG